MNLRFNQIIAIFIMEAYLGLKRPILKLIVDIYTLGDRGRCQLQVALGAISISQHIRIGGTIEVYQRM